jgi:hypothetical protein
LEQAGHSGRRHELGLPAISQTPQSDKIQMIVVIVAEEHNVDARKMLPIDTWRAAAARTDPR